MYNEFSINYDFEFKILSFRLTLPVYLNAILLSGKDLKFLLLQGIKFGSSVNSVTLKCVKWYEDQNIKFKISAIDLVRMVSYFGGRNATTRGSSRQL